MWRIFPLKIPFISTQIIFFNNHIFIQTHTYVCIYLLTIRILLVQYGTSQQLPTSTCYLSATDPLARAPFDFESNATDFRTFTCTHTLNSLIKANIYTYVCVCVHDRVGKCNEELLELNFCCCKGKGVSTQFY